MEAYSGLLERTRVPQPSLQRFAVIQIFEKLRSSPANSNADSDAGREAITQCLSSTSAAVVDQSVREISRLVKSSNFDIFRALLEFQSALQGCNPRFVDLFVKGIGFLVRFGFCKGYFDDADYARVPENHPFVKVLCRPEVQNELVQQIIMFLVDSKQYGLQVACEYLRPLVTFSIMRGGSSESSSSFLKLLLSSLSALYCSLLDESNPLFEMLISCLQCFCCQNTEEFRNAVVFVEFLVDAHIVVLRRLVQAGSMVDAAQLSGVKLLDNLLTLCLDSDKHSMGSRPILELLRRLLSVWRDLGLHYVPEMSSSVLSLFAILTQLELEDEELYMVNLLRSFLKWKIEDDNNLAGAACNPSEILLFAFPAINLISSPSKVVKQAASELLLTLEKPIVDHLTASRGELSKQRRSPFLSKPGMIIVRLLTHLWLQDSSFCSFFLNIHSMNGNEHVVESGSKSWIRQLGEYALVIAGSRKTCDSVSPSQEVMLTEMPLLLSSLVGGLVTHKSLGSYAMETLASLNNMAPKLGVALFLAILYYINLLRHNIKDCSDMMLKLLAMLPLLASHPAMLPLIVQAIIPMLRKDSDRLLYGTALRLMCKAWEMTDRIFGSLHGLLLPERFAEFQSDRVIAISMAACLRDICRRNPDRGIELILSVAACIESYDSVIKSLGFQSLANLCEADAVDFYSAWDVISKDVKDYSVDPKVAYSLCLLLRWGAMDSEAYKEDSRSIVQILWDIGCSNCPTEHFLWKKARIASFEAMNHFEVLHIMDSIQDFRNKAMNLLTCETDVDVLRAIEDLETRVIAYEHSTRQRVVKETRNIGSKIEKLLDAFPRVIFASGKHNARELPGAALYCLPFNPEKSKNASTVFGEYHEMLKEIAASLYLSRNTVLALLSLQSWRTFTRRWLKNYVSFLDLKASSTILDKTAKASNDILKSMIQVAENSIPRVAENVGLAIGAFCMILPASAHPVKIAASKFLLNWLVQYEHEHRQWSAAISLGVISCRLHVTDRLQKLKIVNGLLEVAHGSKNSLIIGVCGVGLGYSCQDLLTRVPVTEQAQDHSSFTQQEKALLGKIIRTLSLTIVELTEISSDPLESLCHYASELDDCNTNINFEVSIKSSDNIVDDLWGITGLVLGLGDSISALFRAGSYEAMCSIKLLCSSWISQAASLVSDYSSGNQDVLIMLSIGACLALPTIASFCRKVEMMNNVELDDLLSSYEDLISKLLLSRTSNVSLQNLFMASCVGAGSVMAFILDEGVLPLDVQRVKDMLESFKSIYTSTNPHLVHLGGLLGVVNTMGADAGSLIHRYNTTILPPASGDKKESSRVNVPLLSNSSFEKDLLELVQDMFLVAQNLGDNQLQAYAAWAMSFVRHHLWSRSHHAIDNTHKNEMSSSQSLHQSFSKDSSVGMLSSWLVQLDFSKNSLNVHTVAAVLRCLSYSPRLPNLDWGVVVRRCMRYEAYTADSLPPDSSHEKRTLRVECLQFSLAHANKFDSLLTFIDELTDLFRFRVLDLVTQSYLLFHMLDLMRVFSSSRIQKLLEEIIEYLSSPTSSYQQYSERQKTFLRLSCWKGLCRSSKESSIDTSLYISQMEKCMGVLFGSLPELSAIASKLEKMPSLEWIESTRCLGNARQSWLTDLLQISAMDLELRDGHFNSVLKKIRATARLVKVGALPMTELSKLKSNIINTKSQGMWEVYIEVVASLQIADGSVKRQWLINVLEMSCMTTYPSTAFLFLGLLAGSWCKYMPLLVLDPQAVLIDLPVTLFSLLSSSSWGLVAETAVSHLWTSTLRIYDRVKSLESGLEPPSFHPIDPTEDEMCNFLLHKLIDACLKLKDYLPFQQRLRLANMIV